MSDTNFIPQVTPIVSTWSQDVNNTVYRLLGDSTGPNGTGGAPATRADIIANMGLLTTVAAASTYLTQANAASTYLTQANAASTYETRANAASTYETQAAVNALMFAFKNHILNGSMSVDQRNSGAAQSIPAAALTYTVDRWAVLSTGSGVTGQQVAGTLSPYHYQITGAVGNTSVEFLQRIEAANINDLAGKVVTISVNLSNSLLTAVGWAVGYASAADNFGTVTAIASGSIAVNPAETRYSFQVTLPAGTANGLQLLLSTANQTSGTFTIGEVQLEEGSVATSFDRRDIGTELTLCQRYYQLGSGIGSDYASAGGIAKYLTVPLAPNMRVAPSVAVSVSGGINYSGGSTLVITKQSVVLTVTALAAGDIAANFTWSASAEI